MNASKGMDLIRLFFGVIDGFVYNLIAIIYNIIVDLSHISIFTEENISQVANKIYIFLGVIMLFKVTFSLITYLINPDTLNDKTQGTGKLINHVLISLSLIIIVPYAFNFLYSAQSAILNDQILERLILGQSDTKVKSMEVMMDDEVCDYTTKTDNYGEYISLIALRPFLQVYDDQNGYKKSDLIGYLDEAQKKYYCEKGIKTKLSKSVLYADTADFNTGVYIFEYSFFFSTVCGILVLLLMINFCFDIAVRSVKLAFFEIIAPIPIISYIDPKSEKNGVFNKWMKQVFSTWISLFLRLAILFLVVYLISVINDNFDAMNTENSKIVMLFLIIGALMFAKQAIPLIENIFGIKLDKTVQLNPFKKISDQAIGGKQLVAAPGKALATGIGLGVSAGGAIAGQIKKSQNVRNEASNLRDVRSNLSTEQKRLNDLQKRMQQNISNYKTLENMQKSNPGLISDKTLKEARSTAIQSGYDWRNQANKVENLNNSEKVQEGLLEHAKEEYKSAHSDNEGNIYFSSAHPIMSTIMQSLRGAKIGFDAKDTSNIARAVTEGINAAKKSAKRTNEFDKFGYLDRLKDLQTDITGVKNESGTTSIVKKEMKEQTELLNNIKNAISSLEHSFGNLKPGAISYDSNGKMSINVSGNYHYDVGEKESIQSLIDQYEALRESEKATTKQIKEYEDVLAINKPPKP